MGTRGALAKILTMLLTGVSAPVLAQTTSVTLPSASAPAGQAAIPGANSQTTDPSMTLDQNAQGQPAQAETGIGEIVVTAQRREENAQRAPIAISVVSSQALNTANVTNSTELSRLVPSLQNARAGGAFSLFFLRGVGSYAANSLTDAAVAVSIDDVPLARQYGVNGQFYDLQRVEVLKGPQGTLYGRNATGGVINVIPQHPVFKDEEDISIAASNHKGVQGNAMVNLALTDQVALRASTQIISHDGYLSDGTGDERSQAVRLQLRADPTEALSILVGGDYFHQDGTGGGQALLSGGYTAKDRVGLADPRAKAYYRSIGKDPILANDLFIRQNITGVHAQANYDVGVGSLVFIPSYRKATVHSTYPNGAYLIDDENDDQKSAELRFVSKDIHGLKATVGTYYLDDDVAARFTVDNRALNRTLPASGNTQNFEQTTHAHAVFGDGTYSLTSWLRLIGGVRYTHEKKDLDGTLTTFATFVPPLSLTPSDTYTSTDYRAGAQLDLSSTSMVYGTVATGFHSGGFFFTHDNPVYQPERLTSYTIGSKNRFFDDRVQLNVEGFIWKYKDQQLSGVSTDSSGSTVFATVNAGQSTIKGVEAELQIKPARNTLLSAQGLYLHSRFDQFQIFQPFPAAANSACVTTFVRPGQFSVNCAGLTPPQSPKWTLNLAAQQGFDLGGGNKLTVDVREHFQTKSYTGINFVPSEIQGNYWLGDVSVGYTAHQGWTLAAFVNNFTNVTVKDNTTHVNVDSAQLRPPRTYGVRLGAHF